MTNPSASLPDSFDDLALRYAGLGRPVYRNGTGFPVFIERVDVPWQGLLIDSSREAWIDPQLAASGNAHFQEVKTEHSAVFDGPVVVLDQIEYGVMATANSGYFNMLTTCDALRSEYASRRHRASTMPLRGRAEELAGRDPLRVGTGRAAAIGVSTIVTLPNGGPRSFVLGRRRLDLAIDGGLWHVVPSGMLEPAHSGDALWRSVQRETEEELGVRINEPDAERLSALGYAFDLLRLRPEICLRLDLAEFSFKVGDEFDRYQLVEVSHDGIDQFWTSMSPAEITPAGAGAVALLQESL